MRCLIAKRLASREIHLRLSIAWPTTRVAPLWKQVRDTSTSTNRQQSRAITKVLLNGFKNSRGIQVIPGETYQLKNGDFLRVHSVIQLGWNANIARYKAVGWRFCSVTELLGLPKADPNKVYWVSHLAETDKRGDTEKILQEFDLSEIICQRNLVLTNNLRSESQRRGGSIIVIRASGQILSAGGSMNLQL